MKTFGYFNRCCYVLVMCVLSLSALAQGQKKVAFELEADPLAYLLRGYSLHVGVTHGHWRHSVGTFGISQPDFFLPNKAFDVFSRGIDFKTDYIFKENGRGWLLGLQANYTWDKVGYGAAFAKTTGGIAVGPRLGYRFFFNQKAAAAKGFYLVPWAAYSYTTNNEPVSYGDQVYRPSSWLFFPTVHLGWRF